MSEEQNGTETPAVAATGAEIDPETGLEKQEPETDSAPVAAPNGGQYITRPWKMKGTGNEIPVRYDKAIVRVRLAAPATDATQAMLNMLALTGGNVQAVVDQFNGSAALDVQKAIKGRINSDGEQTPPVLPSVADLQTQADEHVIAPNQRGGGGGGKRAQQAAKAARLDAVQDAATQAQTELVELWQSDPAAAQAQTALMVKLSLLTADAAQEISGGQYTA
jgi:hypothetical protein